jgi:uncharacterized YigZ family protein
MRYKLPARETREEIVIKNSRFIATLAPVLTTDEAKLFIHKIKTEFKDASHNVPAYIVGHGTSIVAHCNDDGEPWGTAGRPALAVLQGSNLGDAAVVVTRYFGGTKLGKGGLVRAYGDAVRNVLEKTPLAEKISSYTTMIVLPYALFERVKLLIQVHHGIILDEDFAGDITISCQFIAESFQNFQDSLFELTNGKNYCRNH